MRTFKKATQKTSAHLVHIFDSFRLQPHRIDHFDIMRIEIPGQNAGYSLPAHRSNCYVILTVTRGSGSHCIDGEIYSMEPNVVFVLSPGQMHRIEFSGDIAGFSVFFTLDFYQGYARERHFDKIPFFRSMYPQTYIKVPAEKMASINMLLEEMLHEYTRNLMGAKEVLQNYLDIVLVHLNRLWTQTGLIKGQVTSVVQVRKLMQLIEDHYKEGMTAGAYAKEMNLTLNHLNRLCKQSVNLTVTEMIHGRVMHESKRLLIYSDWTVKKIANELGFKDTSYFLRLFKKKTGMTPKAFRSTSAIL